MAGCRGLGSTTKVKGNRTQESTLCFGNKTAGAFVSSSFKLETLVATRDWGGRDWGGRCSVVWGTEWEFGSTAFPYFLDHMNVLK